MKPDNRSAEEILRERAERLIGEGRMPSLEATAHAVLKRRETRVDFVATVADCSLLLSALEGSG